MKRFLVILISLTIITACSNSKNESKEIEQAIIDVFDAMSTGDQETLANLLTEDFQLGEDGMVLSKQDALGFLEQDDMNADTKRVNVIEVIDTHVDGSFGWIAYWNEATFVSPDTTVHIKWLESAVLIKEADGWKLRFAQATTLRDHK